MEKSIPYRHNNSIINLAHVLVVELVENTLMLTLAAVESHCWLSFENKKLAEVQFVEIYNKMVAEGLDVVALSNKALVTLNNLAQVTVEKSSVLRFNYLMRTAIVLLPQTEVNTALDTIYKNMKA